MEYGRVPMNPLSLLLIIILIYDGVSCMNQTEKRQMKEKVIEMFNHAYRNYMRHAYPADELMPISCRGRGRGTEPSRGDIDDVLGNFSLTLIDTLDSLAVLGQLDDFEDAIRKVISDVIFDTDVVVSVFETNIRVLGGLLGGHVMASHFKRRGIGCLWYADELLEMARDVGNRILPAFNTTTGIPYPRVNLRYGIKPGASRTGHEKDTCTACAGTMILEFAALSRLTGDPIYELKAHTAMDFLWKQRHRSSDLVGTVINIHNGDWVRRESGVGAGIDSYYEYMLKAYILLGDETYLDRFNKHYDAVMRYVSQGPMMVDVHMHKPLSNSRNFMDALLAFWPGLQVLKGDLKAAIETHEMLYQVMQRHNFLPEAFTTDFRVHWGQHPLRPEFVESTYFLYKATGDPYYLEVGKSVMDNLERHARVTCGFAAIKDVTTGVHEDQMDSYVLAETFKYLYLLFTEKEDLVFDIDDYLFTTEAHLLPLSLSIHVGAVNATNVTQTQKVTTPPCYLDDDDGSYQRTCPNTQAFYANNINYAHSLRMPLKNLVERICPKPRDRRRPRLRAVDFIAGNKEQLEELRRMGIRIATMKDGRVQLLHTASEAASPDSAEDGMLFMQEMIDLSKQQQQEVQQEPRVVQLMSPPFFGNLILKAGPAQFGYNLKTEAPLFGTLRKAKTFKACQTIQNHEELKGHIAVMERGDCMFIDKARQIQAVGAWGGIVIDHNSGTNSETSPLFAMSGDGRNDVSIPMLFLFHHQGQELLDAMEKASGNLLVMMGYQAKSGDEVMRLLFDMQNTKKGAKSSTDAEQGTSAETSSPDAQSLASEEDRQAQLQAPPLLMPKEMPVGGPTGSPIPDPVEPPTQPAESDATRLLLNKYMKKMKLGDLQVEFSESLQWNQQAESLLRLIEGGSSEKSDSSEQQQQHVSSVQLNDLVTSETNEQITRVYDGLVRLLSSRTNLEALSDRADYLKALADLVEAAFTQAEGGLDAHSQNTLDRLAAELRPRSTQDEKKNTNAGDGPAHEEQDKSSTGGEDLIKAVEGTDSSAQAENKATPTDTTRYYLSESDLAEEGSRSTIIRKAPEWMGLRDGEVMVDKNGIMYVTNGYDFDEDTGGSHSQDALVKPLGENAFEQTKVGSDAQDITSSSQAEEKSRQSADGKSQRTTDAEHLATTSDKASADEVDMSSSQRDSESSDEDEL